MYRFAIASTLSMALVACSDAPNRQAPDANDAAQDVSIPDDGDAPDTAAEADSTPDLSTTDDTADTSRLDVDDTHGVDADDVDDVAGDASDDSADSDEDAIGDVAPPVNQPPSCTALVATLVLPVAGQTLSRNAVDLVTCVDPDGDTTTLLTAATDKGFEVEQVDQRLDLSFDEAREGESGELTLVFGDIHGLEAAPVVIAVYGNIPPVAQPDFAEHSPGAQGANVVYSFQLDALENDSDPDGTIEAATFAPTLVSGPASGGWSHANGTLMVNGTCAATHFWTFRYTVADDAGAPSNETTVGIQVICGIPR